MMQNLKFKPKAGYVYVVTNECLKLVKAKGIFRGKMVKAVKIGNAKDFTNRLGSLNTAVYENFDFHLGIKTDDVVGLEGIIHTALQDYRIYTRDGDATEFFACPLDEVVGRIKNLKGNLLIVSGTADDNVHIANTFEFVSEATSQNKILDMMVYPNKNHFINGCETRLALYTKLLDYFNRNLKK